MMNLQPAFEPLLPCSTQKIYSPKARRRNGKPWVKSEKNGMILKNDFQLENKMNCAIFQWRCYRFFCCYMYFLINDKQNEKKIAVVNLNESNYITSSSSSTWLDRYSWDPSVWIDLLKMFPYVPSFCQQLLLLRCFLYNIVDCDLTSM